jgi:NAD-dependent dihydropyrimidine dehydrogenase PreA subunit
LSRIWGAATMRLDPADIASWPISDLSYYYEVIEKIIPIAATRDGLENTFGLPQNLQNLPISSQAHKALEKFTSNKNKLKEIGIIAGRSRLAVWDDCNLCGNCLHGCPFGKIFSSIDVMPLLKSFSNFKYIKNVRVTSFKEGIDGVSINFRDLNSRAHSLISDRLFFGYGSSRYRTYSIKFS